MSLDGDCAEKDHQDHLNVELVEDEESSVIKMSQVTIKNVSEWSSSVQLEDYMENNRVRDKVAKIWRSDSRKESLDLLIVDETEI